VDEQEGERARLERRQEGVAVEAVELLSDVGELHQPGFADIDTAWFEAPGANGAVSARKP
jgi:hypothetical protein